MLRAAAATAQDLWWTAYLTKLAESGITATSREVIGDDARFVVERGVFGAGHPGAGDWPPSRERRGLVMGAVQSGKTASMMAVAAMALDRGVDALVILGGTRTALWVQTLERVLEQVDTFPDAQRRRVRIPAGEPGELEGSDLNLVYSITAARASRALAKSRPVLAVAMKNTAHLERLSRTFHDVLYPAAMQLDRPFHVLVIDDEADDSSVVDASFEGVDDFDLRRKQVPRRILDLFEARNRPGETPDPRVYATYLAYTATPQANFLQDPANPLAPVDFVASLRTPGSTGDPAVRESSYRVPEGPVGWYTGGEVYYKALSAVPLCVPTDDVDADDLVADGVRAYLVASAIRALRMPSRLGPASARTRSFATKAEARAAVLPPMSMLVNPTAAKTGHFDAATALLNWSHGTIAGSGPVEGAGSYGRQLGLPGVVADMEANSDRWVGWLERYADGSRVVARVFAEPTPRLVPLEWDSVRQVIVEEIIPGTGVAVINSDERADDRPAFSPARADDGTWYAPENSSTIFVSGNVMSRGLTLEGLTTTVFTRSASTPLADTQMQMQRWFGYRGAYIDLCRVLMPRDQIDLFAQYHENDEALRRDVLAAMESGTTPDVTILQGRSFLATGKIANVRAEPLFPGPRPFVRHMNPSGEDGENLVLVANLFGGDVLPVPDMSARRGLLVESPLGLLEAADILDRLVYSDHGPGMAGTEASRWRSVANHARVPDDDPSYPFYRAPEVTGSIDLGGSSPYAIAAYLRLWHAAISRRVPGLMSTDERPSRWDLIDRDALERRRPRFWLGLRSGSGQPITSGPLAALPFTVRPMKRALIPGTNDLEATWGSRNFSGGVITGDEIFDYTARGIEPTLTLDGARLPTSDGLILFHVVERTDGSQGVAVGLGIPLGGPDHIRANSGAPSQ